MANPPPYNPVNSDASSVAVKEHALIAPLLAADSPPVTLPAPGSYDVAFADLMLMTRGLQLRDVLDGPTGTSPMGMSPAYAAAPFGSVVFTPQITKSYLLETRLSLSVSGATGLVQLRYSINGVHYVDPETKFGISDVAHHRIDFAVPVMLTKDVAYTIQWEWIGAASMTLQADANDMRVLRVWS